MLLVVYAKPNARQTKVVDWIGERTIVIAIKAPAAEGKANEELVTFLSKALGVSKTSITLRRGHRGRIKHLELPDSAALAALES